MLFLPPWGTLLSLNYMQDHCFGREEITKIKKKVNRLIDLLVAYTMRKELCLCKISFSFWLIVFFCLIHLTFGKNITILSTSHWGSNEVQQSYLSFILNVFSSSNTPSGSLLQFLFCCYQISAHLSLTGEELGMLKIWID